jgi:hypothetical protein
MAQSSLDELKKRIYSRTLNFSSAADIFRDVDEAARRAPGDNLEVEFMNFAVMFFDRLFGEAVTCCKEVPEGWQSIKYGGWFAEIASFYNATMFKELPDVRSFGTVRFDNRIEKLYRFIQDTVDLNSNMMGVLRQGRLFVAPIEFLTSRIKWLCSKNPSDKYWYHFVQSNDCVHDALASWTSRREIGNLVDGNIRLPPVEYLLLCLVRYPCVQPPQQISLMPKGLQDNVFVRQATPDISFKNRSKVPLTPFTVVMYKYIQDLLPPSQALSSQAQLFLCLVAEYWIGCGLIVRRDHNKFEQKIMQIQLSSAFSDKYSEAEHPPPTEVIFVNDAHRPVWTQLTLECTYLLLWHLLHDTAVENLVGRANSLASQGTPELVVDLELATPAMCFLQQPLFDMLRIYFNGEKQNSLMIVVDIWLLYIQPWVLQAGQLQQREAGYRSSWKYYLAANFHFYTTVLTCFLRFVAKMSHNWESADSLDGYVVFNALIKVLKVFSAEALLTDIRILQVDAVSRYNTCGRYTLPQLLSVENDVPLVSPRITPIRSPTRSANRQDVAPDVYITAVIRHHQLCFPDSKVDSLPNLGLGRASDNKEHADRILRVLASILVKSDVGYLSYVTQLIVDIGAEIGNYFEPY